MKSMTCKQLGGACEKVFSAETFEEIANLSKAHGMEMYTKQDPAHLESMNKMRAMMSSPDIMQKWYEDRKTEFEQLPKD